MSESRQGVRLRSPEATATVAAVLAPRLAPGDALLLEGPLGAGKTHFARALIRALAADPALEVPSPTFAIRQDYAAGGVLVSHFDLWRLSGPHELRELGWDEARAGIVLVEWPDRLGGLAPSGALRLRFVVEGEWRRLSAAGWTEREAAVTAALDAGAEVP